MARETSKSGVSIRRAELRRTLPRGPGMLSAWRTPGTGWAVVIWGLFALAGSLLAIWAREQPLVAVGRVMNTTEVVRVGFTQEDHAATEENRKAARNQTPRVYVADVNALEELGYSIENLPKTVAAAATVEDVDRGIREQFGLTTPERLAAIKAEAVDSEPSDAWRAKTERLRERLVLRPLLDAQTWQRETQSINNQIELQTGSRTVRISSDAAINIEAEDREQVRPVIRAIVEEAGFRGAAADVVAARITRSARPTYRFDRATTEARQEAAAAKVPPVRRERTPGQVIFTRGEVLKPDALAMYRTELEEFRARAPHAQVWLRRASIASAVGAVTLALAGYAALFAPRLRRSAGRAAGVAVLLAGMLAVACFGTVAEPGLVMLAAVAPSVFVAVILCIAYDQRLALAFALLHALLVCIALDQPVGMFALMVTGIGAAVWLLREVRDRGTLMRMSGGVTLALAAGTLLVALVDRPTSPASMEQTLRDALLAGAGGLLVGMVTLFLLPTIEKVFGVLTSMTLIELRDPKHPLLRQLQQRAPGTYNHSLNVANLAEAGAESIGANGLLTYVGALYHDVGKMNKPDYFVENQVPGINKHDKLSPAMSLLVIVGHVKDGVELAREFNLPKALHHFIEAHHGTTLVEYFYHRAKKLAAAAAASAGNGSRPGAGAGPAAPGSSAGGEAAQGGGGGGPDPLPSQPEEIEYRYPGPKPRTKEVAIVMLCDAVESAARSMASPTPSRIEAVVRALAQKRLMDGQFDDCDLTLRELNTVVEAVSKTLASIYHGRVAYPEPEGPKTASVRLEEADHAPRTASGGLPGVGGAGGPAPITAPPQPNQPTGVVGVPVGIGNGGGRPNG